MKGREDWVKGGSLTEDDQEQEVKADNGTDFRDPKLSRVERN